MTDKATVVLISGKQGSGKSTLAAGILAAHKTAFTMKFADPLYQMHEAIRQVCLGYSTPFAQKEGRLLQLLGTEWGRECKGQDVWVNAARSRVEVAGPGIICIDDCRFENELRAFDNCAGIDVVKVRLHAREVDRRERAAGWREDTSHPSETGLDRVDPSAWDLYLDTSLYDPQQVLGFVLRHLEGAGT